MATNGRSFPIVIGVCVILGFFVGRYSPWPSRNRDVPPLNLAREAGQNGSQLNFENAPVNTILDIYEQLSGKRFIRDSNLVGMPPLTIKCNGLSKDEALKLITATLLLNGIAIIPVDDQTMKVITIDTNKNPRSEGLRTYTNATELPIDDQIVTYYMPLTYINPMEAQGIFCQTAPVHVYGAYVPAPSAQAIILTENVSIVRQLIGLKKIIDVPPVITPTPEKFMLTRDELIILSIAVIIAVSAGNFYAYLLVSKKKSKNET